MPYEAMAFPPERREELKAAFDKAKKEDGKMEIRQAHKLIFSDEERKE